MKKKSDPELDPDPLVRGTDPGIRIRTKISRIPNTTNFRKTLIFYNIQYLMIYRYYLFKNYFSIAAKKSR
jgi:hypothetical protein